MDTIRLPNRLDSGIEKLKAVFLVRLQKIIFILFVASTRSMPIGSLLMIHASLELAGGGWGFLEA